MHTTLPFKFESHKYPRLLVKPKKVPEVVSESGLIIPKHENPLCEVGVVFMSGAESSIKPGSEVLYHKMDRSGEEQISTVSVDGEEYDILYENEIWSVDEKPLNQIFVLPIGETEVSAGGIVLPNEIKGVTQKGLVFDAPEKYGLKVGDKVEYRRQEGGLYPEVELDGRVLDVLFERDIFTVNGNPAPYRIVVKINLAQQKIKRSTTQAGILLSPLFIAMLRNLQFAEVTGIGTEAQKMYPELNVGDTAILHHSIEHQPYRILGYEMGQHGEPLYEYRIINCWEEKGREIFGKLIMRYGKIRKIEPVNENIFLDWNFNLLDGAVASDGIISADNDISKYHDIDSLRNALDHKKKNAAESAKLRMRDLRFKMSSINAELDKDRWDMYDSEIRMVRREETELSAYLRRDHLVVCQMLYPEHVAPTYALAFYEELYPINLLGNKYLIAHPDFAIAKLTKNMNIKIEDINPLGDFLFVLPIAEPIEEGGLLMPDSAKEKPQKGKVSAISSELAGELGLGDVVLYPKKAGMEQLVDGVMYLILKRNDCLAVVGHLD